MVFSREYHYSDILLLPNYSECESRNNISLETKFLGYKFEAPYYLANMKTVIDFKLAKELAICGYFYSMHRFVDYDLIYKFHLDMVENELISSLSVGVKDKDKQLINKLSLLEQHPDFITIDIAHGHSKQMCNMIYYIKDKLPSTKVIAGNICTAFAATVLQDCGADAVKVGVGPGHACTTKLMTGFSRPQFSAVLWTAGDGAVKVPVIADGGIEHPGDIAKALVAGAKMVMCGHLLAGFEESPGDVIIHSDGRRTKAYFGSASEDNKTARKNVEGRRLEIPLKGSIWHKLEEINESLQSSCSYAGVNNPSELEGAVEWVVQK